MSDERAERLDEALGEGLDRRALVALVAKTQRRCRRPSATLAMTSTR
jgi:hypothetical protein